MDDDVHFFSVPPVIGEERGRSQWRRRRKANDERQAQSNCWLVLAESTGISGFNDHVAGSAATTAAALRNGVVSSTSTTSSTLSALRGSMLRSQRSLDATLDGSSSLTSSGSLASAIKFRSANETAFKDERFVIFLLIGCNSFAYLPLGVVLISTGVYRAGLEQLHSHWNVHRWFYGFMVLPHSQWNMLMIPFRTGSNAVIEQLHCQWNTV